MGILSGLFRSRAGPTTEPVEVRIASSWEQRLLARESMNALPCK